VQATETFPVPVVDDEKLLAGLLTREAAGFTEVYEAYAARLYDYAIGLLGSVTAAEDAVTDSLLVAVDRVGGLSDPRSFGIWLYALTRNECLRQLQRGRETHSLHATYGSDAAMPVGVERNGPQWIQQAIVTIDQRGREVLDLAFRHGLGPGELAAVLGVSARRASALAASARTRLQTAAVRIRAADPTLGLCGELRNLLVGRDGDLPPAMRDMVDIHRATCWSCAAVSRGEAHAAQVYGTLPPVRLSPHLYSAAFKAATVPSRVSARGELAEPFRRSGFPMPLDRGSRGRGTSFWVLAGGAAMASLILLVTFGGFMFRPEPRERAVERPIAGPASNSPVSDVTPSPPNWSPLPTPTPTVTPSRAPSPRPVPRKTPRRKPTAPPRPTPTRPAPGGGSGRPAQVDALFADATVGCPRRWRGTATAFVRFAIPRQVTFLWGDNPNPNRQLPMLKLGEATFQTDVRGLPTDRTVYWRVVAVTLDGRTTITPVSTIRHDRNC
jgi:RNA polymerase sigma factor (sigma-70 family)